MKPTITHSSRSRAQAQAGHASGDLRQAFGEAVDAFDAWKPGNPEPKIELGDQQHSIRQVCGLLWNCTDVTPQGLFDEVRSLVRWAEDEPGRRTYAACARLVARLYDQGAGPRPR